MAAHNRLPSKTVVGVNIRRLKEESGLTWPEIAQDTGVEVRHLYNWSAGRFTPRLHNLERLAKAFDVPLDELVKEQP